MAEKDRDDRPLPTNPKDLARAMFAQADRAVEERQQEMTEAAV